MAAALLTAALSVLALAVACLSWRVGRLARDVAELKGRRHDPARPGLHTLLAWLAGGALCWGGSPADAVAAAWKDAQKLPPRERVFAWYIHWPDGWPHARLLTKAQANLLSTRGKIGEPVWVTRSLARLDVRDYGWEKRLGVREKFAQTDFVFRQKWRFAQHATLKLYVPFGVPVKGGAPPRGRWFPAGKNGDGSAYPAGYWDGDTLVRRAASPLGEGEVGPAAVEKHVKPGDELFLPAVWANPPAGALPAEGAVERAQDGLRRMLSTEAPIVFGPAWMVQVGRQESIRNRQEGNGYFDFLGVKSRKDYFDLIGLDERKAIDLYQEWREVVVKSGISKQNRQVVLLRATSGLAWATLDVFSQEGRGVAKTNLRRGEFAHDAERWIGKLPWGGPVNGLFNAKGELQSTAPDKVGGDKSSLNPSEDLRIHPDSCWNCHGTTPGRDYIVPFEQWARNRFRPGKSVLRDPSKRVLLELESTYLRDIDWLIEADRRDFARAVAQLTSTGPKDPGLTVAGFTRIYRGAFNQYVNAGVTLGVAAAELGVAPEKLLAGLRKYNEARGASDLVLVDFLDSPPGAVPRLEWESRWQLAMVIALGLRPPEIPFQVEKAAGRLFGVRPRPPSRGRTRGPPGGRDAPFREKGYGWSGPGARRKRPAGPLVILESPLGEGEATCCENWGFCSAC